MEIGFIPNRTAKIREDLKSQTTDRYADTVRYDHDLPLRGMWIKGEFALMQLPEPTAVTKRGECLQVCKTEEN